MITGIILASGFSSRMGKDKLLLEIEGEKIIEKVIKAGKKSNLDEIILVYRKAEIGEVGDKYGVTTVENEKSSLGQSESVKLGVLKSKEETEGYMFLMGDQPFLTYKTINKIIKEFYKRKNYIIIPYYSGIKGNPVLFPSNLKEELLSIEGDKGGRDIIREKSNIVFKVFFESGKLGMDIDTPKDFSVHKGGYYGEFGDY